MRTTTESPLDEVEWLLALQFAGHTPPITERRGHGRTLLNESIGLHLKVEAKLRMPGSFQSLATLMVLWKRMQLCSDCIDWIVVIHSSAEIEITRIGRQLASFWQSPLSCQVALELELELPSVNWVNQLIGRDLALDFWMRAGQDYLSNPIANQSRIGLMIKLWSNARPIVETAKTIKSTEYSESVLNIAQFSCFDWRIDWVGFKFELILNWSVPIDCLNIDSGWNNQSLKWKISSFFIQLDYDLWFTIWDLQTANCNRRSPADR